MCEDLQGNLWFGTHQKGIYKYSPTHKKITIYDNTRGISSNTISYLFCDKKGNVWAGTWGGGINVITSNKIKVYNTENGLQDDYIWKITEDAEGNILIGTTAHGLSIFKGEYMVNFAQPNSLLNKQVSAILQDHEKNIWFGTNNGILIYNPKQSSDASFIRYNSENSILSNPIRFLKKDKNGNIWVGTDESGVFMYDKTRHSFSYPSPLNNLLPDDKSVTSLEVDHKNNLWIGTTEGLIFYNIGNGEGNRFTTLNGLAGDYITALYSMSNNSLVIGSKGKGIAVFNDSSRLVYQLNNSETPLSFVEGKDGVLWIGTESHGLLGFKNGKIVKHYGIKEGLLSNLVNFVNCDGNGNIYCGTNKGLNKIELATNKIYIYTRKNGYYGIESNKNATYTDSDGYIWFGTVNGAVRYAPWLDQPSMLQPLTHIFRFRVNQVDFDITPNIVLKSSQNSIIFDYISICLSNPDAVQYQVKLEGIDKDWQPVTNQTSIAYPVLPPHKYEFKVRARNSAGVWNTVPAFFSFEISPPLYKRWYFILALVGSMVVFLVIYIKLREHNLVVEKNVLEEKVKTRTYEVMNINEELAMKNKDVLASIQYAKRIQLSVLPSAIPFENTFVLFKPKDIVSGDFFWFMEDETYQWMAAVDCTGHGVPGAFMSLIGYNSLNKIVRERQIKLPSDILNQLNEELTKTLHQNEKEGMISDGMDISLIRYNKITHVLDFSGAFNPLWIIRKRELLELRADRFAIGRTPHINKSFSNDSAQLQPDDTIYLFTDGYADQFGGPNNKKYKVYKFKEHIINIQQYSMQKQKEMLEESIEKWRGKEIQVDDILVIGRKFKF
jgi:ligand-binding sensor domain-containing protein